MDLYNHTHANSGSGHSGRSEKGAGFRSLISAQYATELEKKINSDSTKSAPSACKKEVEVIAEKGVVKAIRVRCSCGEVTEIDCHYLE